MKIAFVSQYFFPEQFSNTSIAKSIRNNGHDITVLTAVPNYPKGEFFEGYSNCSKRREMWGRMDIHRVFTIPRKTGPVSLALNYFSFMLFGGWAAQFLRFSRPDVIFVSQLSPILMCIPGIFMARRFKAPLVYWVQDIWPESAIYTLGLKSPVIVKPLTWLCGWIYRQADLVLVQSAAFPGLIERFNVPSERIRVFPNTAPDSYRPVAPENAKQQAELVPQKGFRLMFAGNIGESQDFDTYIEAAKLLKDITELTWVIVGSGRDMDRVQLRVKEAGLSASFVFLGRFPEESMPRFFAHADAMLVGLKDNSIFRLTVPYKVQCYMACAKPIIASLTGEGARIINQAGAGVVAPAQNPVKLAEKIRQLVKMLPAERNALGQNGRRFFEQHYLPEKVYADLDRWLREVSIQPEI